MQLLDLNQVMFSTFFVNVGKHTNIPIDEHLFRHMALNAIRAINMKFKSDYGQLVICNDSYKNWRKDFFPYYKASRKKARDESDIDWTAIFACMGQIKAELKEFFPYKFMEIEGAEADDIIGTICHNISDEQILIISGDKDYRQLHKRNVRQYDSVNKKFITERNPEEFLFEHIIRGDSGDGVPNIASPDNVFVLGERQGRITKKVFESVRNIKNDETNKYYRNYMRNKKLIDLSQSPDTLKDKIMETFNGLDIGNKSQLLGYFSKYKLKQLMEHINDF